MGIQVASRASVRPFTAARQPRSLVVVNASSDARLRLHNLSPEPGSRRDEKRKGRGYAAGQVRDWDEAFAAQNVGGARSSTMRPAAFLYL